MLLALLFVWCPPTTSFSVAPIPMTRPRLTLTTDALLHLAVRRACPVDDSRPLTAWPLSLDAELVARVRAEVLHLPLPQGLRICFCPTHDDERSSVTTTMELEGGTVGDFDAELVQVLSSV